MFNSELPKIDLDSIELTADERAIAELIVASKGKNKGRLRASKPAIEEIIYTATNSFGNTGRYRVASDLTGKAAYVWRMVAFIVSPIGAHHCLPIMADFDLPCRIDEPREKRDSMRKEMDKLADKITDSIKKSEWYGVHRWDRALYG